MSTKKTIAKEKKVRQLKMDRAELEKMCDEAVNLVELYRQVTIEQRHQLEKIAGAGVFGRILRIFVPAKLASDELNKMSAEFLSKLSDNRGALDGNHTS